MKWLRKAAEQGNADAQSILGIMFSYGQGVPQNYAEAMKWFRKSADQGNADAQVGLAMIGMSFMVMACRRTMRRQYEVASQVS